MYSSVQAVVDNPFNINEPEGPTVTVKSLGVVIGVFTWQLGR